MNMTDKLVRQASMCVWIEVMRVGGDTFGDTFIPNDISQGPLKIWTEHSPISHFLKFALRGKTYEGP